MLLDALFLTSTPQDQMSSILSRIPCWGHTANPSFTLSTTLSPCQPLCHSVIFCHSVTFSTQLTFSSPSQPFLSHDQPFSNPVNLPVRRSTFLTASQSSAHYGLEQPKIQTEVLGHSLVRLLVCSHRSLVCLFRTACFACALRCAHSLACSLILLTLSLVGQ